MSLNVGLNEEFVGSNNSVEDDPTAPPGTGSLVDVIDDVIVGGNNVDVVDVEAVETELPEVPEHQAEEETQFFDEERDGESDEWFQYEEEEEEVPVVIPETQTEHGETPFRDEDDSPVVVAPEKGMVYDSCMGFVTHIHRFGFVNGFQVRIRDSVLSKEAKAKAAFEKNVGYSARSRVHCLADEEHYSRYIKLTLECSKAGKNTPCKIGIRRSISCRIGCMFRVSGSKDAVDGTWSISNIIPHHNHDLNCNNSRYLPNYRNVSPVDRKIMLDNDRAGVKIGSNYQVFVVKYGGCAAVPFTERDMRNILRADGRRQVAGGDFNAMQKHFTEMKQRSPSFYYEYDIDEEGILRNVFWADGRSRAAAKEFGDTVSFDSTYVTNRYRMPFSPFIAVNHHGNSLLLGCALITSEDSKSYEWIFKAWVRCMGREPVGIITDQCKSIAKAVRAALPNTNHRWCIWHIKRNLTKNLGSASNWLEINSEFRKLLSHMMTVSEFQEAWKAWGVKHKLEAKDWFKSLYKDRKRWVPVYFKNEFWAGMSSTQRSEGMNHFFKGYVCSNTTLKVFLDQYGLAVEKRASEEDTLKFSDRHCLWSTSTKHGFELVFQEKFTSAKFLEIQEQIERLSYANGILISVNDDEVKYEVSMSRISASGVSRRRKFLVSLDKVSMDLKCECKNFEFKGIICTHALSVMILEGIDVVPEKFLYARWRKDIPRLYLKEKLPYNNIKGNETPAMKRYGEMSEVCSRICLSAMENEDVFKELMSEFGKLSLLIEGKISSGSPIVSSTIGGVVKVYGRRPRDNDCESGDASQAGENPVVKDPIDRRGRGRTPLKRKGADIDKKISGSKRKSTAKKKFNDTPLTQKTQEQPNNLPQAPGVFGYQAPVSNQFGLDPSGGVQMQMPNPYWVPPFPFSFTLSPSPSSQPPMGTGGSKNERS